jgi:repressor LexA
MTLTPKQQRVLSFIETYTQAKGYAPSQSEIAKRFRFASLGTVQNYLKALEAKGYLARQKYLSRSLRLAEWGSQSVTLPLAGKVAAGRPIEAVEQHKTVDVPPALLRGGDNFALQVQGDSMIEEGIHDGDLVIVRKQDNADNGQIVIAMLDGEATVKRLYLRKDRIELRPANVTMRSIFVRHGQGFQILGIVVGLIRKY